jgi:hypothetical protein
MTDLFVGCKVYFAFMVGSWQAFFLVIASFHTDMVIQIRLE